MAWMSCGGLVERRFAVVVSARQRAQAIGWSRWFLLTNGPAHFVHASFEHFACVERRAAREQFIE